MSVPQVECVWPLLASLGEGPVWIEREAALWFTDIEQHRICRFDPVTGERRTWEAPEKTGFVLPARGGRFVAGLQSGLHWFDPASGEFALLLAPEPDRPGNRLNDASVGPDGCLWFGSMDDGGSLPTGAVYRMERNGRAQRVVADCPITNGPVVSPDGGTFYYTDTLARTIFAFDIASDGSLSNRRVFAHVDESDGHPDGSTVDSVGGLWIGLWGGGRVRRYHPDGGTDLEVPIPASQVTKVALGGADRRTAFVTTARSGLDESELRAKPLTGSLFAFRVDVPGVPNAEIAVDH